LACAIWTALDNEDLTIAELAEDCASSEEMLRRSLRGENWLTFRDMPSLAKAFPGRRIIPDGLDLVPPG